jgi:two-component system, cell cycle sensor histidine kinase and response regulator CckA
MQSASTQRAPARKVLIVEDEGLIAHDISSHLQAHGHEVIAIASTAQEALESAAGADIVLMDIRIDGPIDGVRAAVEIRERFHVPVVFLTAHSDRGTLERAKAARPFGYIVKPLAHASLNTSIEIAIDKHRVERQTEISEAWLRTILSSIGDAVVVTDTEGRVMMLNRAAETITGCANSDAQGHPIGKIALLSDDDSHGAKDESVEPVALAILRDAPVPLDRHWKLVTRDGREVAVEGSVAPVKVAGTAVGAVLSFHDVSAQRWEERQVRQAHKLEAAGRLAAGVSNGYSGLFGIIRNRSEHLLRQFAEYSPARAALEEIQQAAAAGEQINRQLAAFGTRQAGRKEILSLNAILRKSAKVLESVAGPSIVLAIRTDAATSRIKGDAAQIEQAIMTMAMHACSTMPTGGRLTIETGNVEVSAAGPFGSYARLALTYTGAEPDPEKLFEPSAASDGGLALSLVHAFAVEHGGWISAQPAGRGGCRIELLLPGHADAALMLQPGTSDAPAILLVDGRERIRHQLHNFFEANGYNLLEAANREEAVALGLMHERRPDLLIADAAQAVAIAAELESEHLKVIRIVEGPEAGPDEIRRPFSQQALLKRVEALLLPRAELESSAAAGSE